MKKLLTLSVMFILCLLTFATDFMRIKLKDGNIARYEVDNIEEVDFEIGKDTSIIGDTTAVDTSATPLRFRITSGSTAEVSGYRYYYNNTDSIAIPKKVRINGKIYNVTSIGDGVFGGYSGLTSIRIPESVTSIGAEAFIGCSDLTRINIPEGVTRIDSSTFARCSSLREITLPKNVTSIGNSAFSGCNGLKSIQIPSSVTDIDKFAFYRCINLDVTIDNSEENVKVGEFAFEACKSVTYLKNKDLTVIDTSDTPLKFIITSDSTAEVIPNTNGYYWWWYSPAYPDLDSIVIPSKIRIENKIYSVSSISDWAFCGCSSLTSISIPNSVTSIGHSAFSGCSGLTSINIPNSIKSIADTTFAGCSKLTSIDIPNSVTSIGYSAFSGCSGLTSINIPEGVTSIGHGAFYGCSGLTSINIPEGVTSIGSSAFYGCSGLTSISIPESVTSIGSSAFSGCTNLDVTIDNSEGNVKVGEFAFEACKSVTYLIIDTSDTPLKFRITSDSTAEVTRDYSYEDLDSIFIPAKVRIDGKVYDVTYIDEYAFVYCSNLTSINVSSNKSNYSSIDGVLFNKNKTEKVNVPRGRKGTYSIPSSVTSINSWAFNGCSGLTSINIPNSVTSIGDGAFKGCYDLTSINIPNSVTSIGDGAFYNCYDLTSVSIPDSVSSIGSGAFEGCNKLEPKLLVYDNGTKCYGWVGNRDSCINVVIPSGVKSIGNRAFYGCSGLTSINIPEGVSSIGEWAFYGCSGLTSVYIPNSIHSFGDYAFYDCTNLDIVIDAYNHNIGIQGHNAFKNCKSVTFRSDYVR